MSAANRPPLSDQPPPEDQASDEMRWSMKAAQRQAGTHLREAEVCLSVLARHVTYARGGFFLEEPDDIERPHVEAAAALASLIDLVGKLPIPGE